MSKYSISDIENLVKNSNKDNKKIIVNTIKQILREDDTLDVKLMEINNINKKFFKLDTKCCKNDNVNFCTICQDYIKKNEHKTILNNCKHVFHKKCLNKLLIHDILKFNCPNCKMSYQENIEKIINDSSDANL